MGIAIGEKIKPVPSFRWEQALERVKEPDLGELEGAKPTSNKINRPNLKLFLVKNLQNLTKLHYLKILDLGDFQAGEKGATLGTFFDSL